MKEKTFQTKFNKWLATHKINSSAVFELKLAKGNSIAFSAVKDHQLRNLKLAQKRLIYKIPDCGYDQKPFDCFQIYQAVAYVVVMFYRRGQKEFILINVDTWIREQELSDRKSLTEKRAKEIGLCLKLKPSK